MDRYATGLTTRRVNARMKAMGRLERITRDPHGYLYWYGGNGLLWPSIMVYRISDVTMNEVMAEVQANISRDREYGRD